MPLSLCPCSLSPMLTLLSLISAECCNCSPWDGPVSHGHPAHPDQELLRMGCLLLLLLFPSSSHQSPASKRDRGGFQCPSSLQAQEDQLPAALHQESHLHLGWNGMIIHFPFMARCEDLLLCQCPGFLPSSFLSLSSALLQKKKQPTKEKKPKKPTKNICSRIEVDIWNSPIAHWCCGWGKLLSFSGAAAATQGQLWDMILNCSCSQSWARLALQLYAWTGFLAISTMCGSPPHMPLRAATVGDNAALWEMMQHCGRCWGWPPAGSGLVIITTTTSDVHRRDRNSDFCLFTFLWPWFLCSYGKKKPKFPSLSSCTSSTCLQCPFLFVAGTVIGETSGFTVNF